MRIPTFVSVFFLAISAIPASADQTFECKIDSRGSTWIIRDNIQFVIDQELGTATVSDALISEFGDTPHKAKFSNKRDGRYWLRWQVKNVPIAISRYNEFSTTDRVETKTQIIYEAWLNPKTMNISIKAKPRKVTYPKSRTGVCEIKR